MPALVVVPVYRHGLWLRHFQSSQPPDLLPNLQPTCALPLFPAALLLIAGLYAKGLRLHRKDP